MFYLVILTLSIGCSYLMKTEFVPYFDHDEVLLITSQQTATIDTLPVNQETYQQLIRWLNVNDKWLRGGKKSYKDIVFSQESSEFYLRFSENGSFVSVRGLFDKVSHGNFSPVSYYQEIQEGELNFLLER
ncbi:MAG: hypothetical protein ACRBFS_21135 [Aureispira sp.]